MGDFKQNQAIEASKNGLLHIEKSTGWAAEIGNHLPDAYGMCEGTWSEFVDDVKRTIRGFADEIRGRFEDARDALRDRFHGRSARRTNLRLIR